MAIVGESRLIQQLRRELMQAAQAHTTVLLQGETGAGKEMAARFLYENSSRAGAPFVAVNCSAIPETLLESEFFGFEKGAFTGAERAKVGLFEKAQQGILFLDEIGELDLRLQPKILRVLEEKNLRRLGGVDDIRLDVRVVCATHRNLKEMVAQKLFREDLYFRLNVHVIHLPPLRQRREDIPALLDYFLKRLSTTKDIQVEPGVYQVLERYTYPGNVRELANIIERALLNVAGESLSVSSLPHDLLLNDDGLSPEVPEALQREGLESLFDELSLNEMVESFERELISRYLAQNEGNAELVARKLKISKSTLYSKISKYGLR